MEAWNYANLWESVAAAAPDRPALIQGPRVVSYRDFDRRANALARRMLEAGVSHQSKVGAYLYNAPEYLESYFAAVKAGWRNAPDIADEIGMKKDKVSAWLSKLARGGLVHRTHRAWGSFHPEGRGRRFHLYEPESALRIFPSGAIRPRQ